MADDDVPEEADEVSDDELEEADEESFPASDPPASWSGPEENSTRPGMRSRLGGSVDGMTDRSRFR